MLISSLLSFLLPPSSKSLITPMIHHHHNATRLITFDCFPHVRSRSPCFYQKVLAASSFTHSILIPASIADDTQTPLPNLKHQPASHSQHWIPPRNSSLALHTYPTSRCYVATMNVSSPSTLTSSTARILSPITPVRNSREIHVQ